MNLRQIRKKIKSVKNVKKITKAMQMVSSVKMRKAQERAVKAREYSNNLQQIVTKVQHSEIAQQSEFITQPFVPSDNELVILLTSNKGLAGNFLGSIEKYAFRNTSITGDTFISVGQKGSMFLGYVGANVIASFTSMAPITEVSSIFKTAYEAYLNKRLKSISIIYNKFVSTMQFETVKETILPLKFLESNLVDDETIRFNYNIEPLSLEFMNTLFRNYIEDKIRNAVLNSEAAEHSARMLAMKSATENASNVITDLTLTGNKLRQEKITAELLDMITAKESVES